MRPMLIAGVVWTLAAACGGKAEPAPTASTAATAPTGPTTKGAPAPKAVDLSDNPKVEQLAKDSLAAYRDKNVERLAELGPPGAKEKTIFIEPRNPRYEELLGDSSWRMQSLRAWDGQTISKLERGVDVAFAWYHQDDKHRYGVELRLDNGRWSFHDLVQRPL